jgi:hypothetical protein
MAKKPTNIMDEEAIIRRRDGVADPASDTSLDADSRRALADARLRALAFALGDELSTAEPGEFDEADLLAYLLDTLPEDRLLMLDSALRGDARAFGRLMALRSSLSAQTDRRDRQRADHPARNIPRRKLGPIDIRNLGNVLQFRETDIPSALPQRMESEPSATYHSLLPSSDIADFLSGYHGEWSPRQLRWDQKTGLAVSNMLQRAAPNFVAGSNLANEARSLLEKWEHFNFGRGRRQFERRKSDSSESGEDVSARLVQVLNELQQLADSIQRDMASVISSIGMVEPRKTPVSRWFLHESAPAMELRAKASMPSLETDRWSRTIDIEAGPWALQLSGVALPAPQLAVTLRRADEKVASVQPLLTLVRPRQGFETANVSPDGHAKMALPQGQTVLLVQSNEVWEVHLNYRAV